MAQKLDILIVGYGKMGRAIETLARQRGHKVVAIISDRQTDLNHICKTYKPSVALEFTHPASAPHNIETLIEAGIPTVSGSTGWLEHFAQIEALVKLEKGSFFYASNFSLGMNITFRLAEMTAQFLNLHPEYEVDMEEIHHTEKKDKPSGTAITLANKIISKLDRKKDWKLDEPSSKESIGIQSIRKDHVPGTHTVRFHSEIDEIEIRHTAHNRMGFALGALLAAEWLAGKRGVFGMDDLMAEAFEKV